jgi:hypothetical protein
MQQLFHLGIVSLNHHIIMTFVISNSIIVIKYQFQTAQPLNKEILTPPKFV